MRDVAQSQVGRSQVRRSQVGGSQVGGAPPRCAATGLAVVTCGSGAIIRG